MNGLGINDIEIGVSADGAWEYYNNLNTNAIQKAQQAVLDLNEVKTTFQQNWQGQAEVNFERNMEKAANVVNNEFEKASKMIESLIAELVENWAEQDKNMVEEQDLVNF